MIALVSDAATFISSEAARTAVAESIANMTAVPSMYVDVDLSLTNQIGAVRRLRGAGADRHLSSGSVLIAYAIHIPGDVPVAVNTTGDEVEAALSSSNMSDVSVVMAHMLQTFTGSSTFSISVTSMSAPKVMIEEDSTTTMHQKPSSSTSLQTALPSTTSTPDSVSRTSLNATALTLPPAESGSMQQQCGLTFILSLITAGGIVI